MRAIILSPLASAVFWIAAVLATGDEKPAELKKVEKPVPAEVLEEVENLIQPEKELVKRPITENEHTTYICSQTGWQSQYRTPDGSYVDIMFETHAIEVDFINKWQEAIGQALFYSISTGRKPGILLLVKNMQEERRFYLRALAVCAKYDIQILLWDTEKLKPIN